MHKNALHFARANGLGLLVLAAMTLATGCGVSLWFGIPPSAVVNLGSDSGAEAMAAPSPAPAATHRVGGAYDAGYEAGMSPVFYASGTSGTVTVPAGAYVIGYFCIAATSGSATLTITPTGPSSQGIVNPQPEPVITIPAGTPFNAGTLLLSGTPSSSGPGTIGPLQMGVGSTLVFTGTASYTVAMYQYGGP